ncbi:fumarylacetoacetase [Talaromyces islandicus]|uniref:Fumarylacetoacetase n=1 Tax=Talaromyces islandicus TaxID=28573 RepID=A0A0U1M943_TALIS|nr:fumarylacetoacetase [Talaromyces islandicus]
MGVKIEVPVGSPFTIHNIPFGVISTQGNPKPRCATAIGDYAIDLAIYAQHGFLSDSVGSSAVELLSQPSLNAFSAFDYSVRKAVRDGLITNITNGSIPEDSLIKLDEVTMHLPFQIGGFSDFYCSLEHVQNCTPLSKEPSIPTNWYYAPSAYNGRISSIVPSPQPIRRPRGVSFGPNGKPIYGPSLGLDYELEMGFFVSKPVKHGTELDINEADQHIFGFVLLNDWSSRDLQLFEMRPLGPFNGKSFGTSISPWVVTMDALRPYRCAPNTKQDPPPFDHLKWPTEEDATFDIKLEIELIRDGKTHSLATSNLRYLYWTPFQQIAHQASAMSGLNIGDLLGTGTISGSGVDSDGKKAELGCLLEANQAGTKDLELVDGTRMQWLNDGDEVVLKAWCGDKKGEGAWFGFGECRGKILPAPQ